MLFDVAIIGGGPGGYVCAIRAAQLGLKVLIVEKEHLGGTCLNKGCIPTKVLLQAAKVKHIVDRASEFGIESTVTLANIDKIIKRSENIVFGLNNGVTGLLAKYKIVVIKGTATFKDKETLLVSNAGQIEEIRAKNIVIATGATPKLIPGIADSMLESNLIWTSKEAISPKFFPKKLLIVGSGAIGIELASLYNSLGSNVTVVEIASRILIQEDKEIADTALKLFTKYGINIKVNTKVKNFVDKSGKVAVEFTTNDNETTSEIFDVVIFAIGVTPNTANLNLENVGVKTNVNGTIEVFDYQETSQNGIYAIGDVVKTPWLAHKASREGIIVAEKIAGCTEVIPINLDSVPSCIYSFPQIASIGITEEKAKKIGTGIKIGKSYFKGNGKALATGEYDGFVKVIFDEKTGELLGAHMIGYEVTELLAIFSVAITGELTEKELMSAIFPHPTMSECLQEAVFDAFGKAIHQ
ncbi:MAG: dihydrolipoyl dehydrogenase [Holosporales bacterium]|jgi:dihydrolipoamide dehydrogenase|nr:dihydrolipoyl dehydrogenase [Holosporales bacterium]